MHALLGKLNSKCVTGPQIGYWYVTKIKNTGVWKWTLGFTTESMQGSRNNIPNPLPEKLMKPPAYSMMLRWITVLLWYTKPVNSQWQKHFIFTKLVPILFGKPNPNPLYHRREPYSSLKKIHDKTSENNVFFNMQHMSATYELQLFTFWCESITENVCFVGWTTKKYNTKSMFFKIAYYLWHKTPCLVHAKNHKRCTVPKEF